MKKSKFLKTLAFSSLAVVMAAGGIFAFAPIGASASSPPPTTTTGLGLDPKNDPVVYTTESGLEIRMSNANKFSGATRTTTNTGKTYTQDLTSFYYFTMGSFSGTIYTHTNTSYTLSNEPVNWIILGVGSHSSAFIDSVSNYLFSIIKNNDYLFSNGEYYFDNQHETFSPAGQLIDSTISAKTYIMGKVKESIIVHTDIPKGCMLVLSEKLLGQCDFNSISPGVISNRGWGPSSESNYVDLGGGSAGNRYRYKADNSSGTNGALTWNNKTNGSLFSYINNLFSKSTNGTILNNSLSFTQVQADLIVPQQLYTYYSNGNGYNYTETFSTDGGTNYTMFPLASNRALGVTGIQNFCMEDYLKTETQRVASFIGSNQSFFWYLRSGLPSLNYGSDGIKANGSYDGAGITCAHGVRPAMVMQLN